MGNANSSRKITVPNDDPTGVIKVSEAVAKRIKGSTGDTQNVRGGPESRQDMVPAPAYQQQGCTVASLTALQVQQCKEEELRKNDEYWLQRLHRQQESHKAMDRHMMQEYDQAVSDVNCSLFKVPDPNDEVPCRSSKDTVAKCYKQNRGQPLKCIQEVLAFQACVDVKRMEKIENRA